MDMPESRYRPKVGLILRRQHPERNVLHQSSLDPPRTEYTPAVPIHQHLRHHVGVIGRLASLFRAIHCIHRRKIQVVDHITDEVSQVVLRQPLAEARRQQQFLIRIVRSIAFPHKTLWIDSVWEARGKSTPRLFLGQAPRYRSPRLMPSASW